MEKVAKVKQELHHAYCGYHADKCPICEAFKLKAEEYKQMLSWENKVPWGNAERTSLWLRKEEAVAFRQAKALNLRCYECKETEGTLEWYQCHYKMSMTSTKRVP
jgi:hypothetical protein